jgi:diguanylate cyclase (GGDEF)-like protein
MALGERWIGEWLSCVHALGGEGSMGDHREQPAAHRVSPRLYLIVLQMVFTFVLYARLSLPHITTVQSGLLAVLAGLALILLTIPRTWLTSAWFVAFLTLGNLAVLLGMKQGAQDVEPWIAFCALLLIGMSSYSSSILPVALLSGLVAAAYGVPLAQRGDLAIDHLAALAVLLSLAMIFVSRAGMVHAEIQRIARTEEQARHESMCDALTGLPNRAQFVEHVARSIQCHLHDHEFHFAVLFLDLDGFKPINDTLGHKAGDAVLRHVAKRLHSSLRKGDVAGRYGGDEFTLLINNVSGESDAIRVAERILAKLKEPMEVGRPVTVGASIGIALSTNLHERPEDLIRDADGAMYRAKSLGKNRYAISEQVHDIPKQELKERIRRLALARW